MALVDKEAAKSYTPQRASNYILPLTCCLFSFVSRAQAPEGIAIFLITPVESRIKFDVTASVAIEGVFDKWDASLTFTSPDVRTGILDVKIQAASVNTGSGMKNRKLPRTK